MSTTQPTASHANPLKQMLQSIFSDNSNIMLAAIISLLLVILFVLLLHLYAKWFLAHAHAQAQARRRRRRRRTASVTVSDVIDPARFHHFHSFNLRDSPISNSPTKGLDSASIAAIPVFVYEAESTADEEGDDRELECVICLSVFEDGETGRSLPKCGHAFHVECIDMWFNSHSNCPLCRSPIVELDSQLSGSVHDPDDSSAVLEIVIDFPSSEISENDRGTEIIISANNDNDNNGGISSDSAISISETSSSLLGCSLKRMFSKVFPSSNVSDEIST